MGGGQSTEQDVYNVVRWVPGLGSAYSGVRAIVKEAEGQHQEAIDSAFGTFGIAGAAILSSRDWTLFDNYDEQNAEWIGTKQQATAIPANFFEGHLFDRSIFMFYFDEVPSDEVRKLFDLSSDDIMVKEAEYTNIPAFRNGSSEFSHYDALNESVVLTSYLVAYSSKSRQCAVFVRTFSFHGWNIMSWSKLDDTKREEIEEILRKFRDAGRKFNAERMQARKESGAN